MGFVNWFKKLPELCWPFISRRTASLGFMLLILGMFHYWMGFHTTRVEDGWIDVAQSYGVGFISGGKLYAVIEYLWMWSFKLRMYKWVYMPLVEQFGGFDNILRKVTLRGGYMLIWPVDDIYWRVVVAFSSRYYAAYLNVDHFTIKQIFDYAWEVWIRFGMHLWAAREEGRLSLAGFYGGDIIYMTYFFLLIVIYLALLSYHRFWCVMFATNYESMWVFKQFSLLWLLIAGLIIWVSYRVYFVMDWKKYTVSYFFPKLAPHRIANPRRLQAEWEARQKFGAVYFWLLFPTQIALYCLLWRADLSGFVQYDLAFGETWKFFAEGEYYDVDASGFEYVQYIRFIPFIVIYYCLGWSACFTGVQNQYRGEYMEYAAKAAVPFGFMLLFKDNICLFLLCFQWFIYVVLNALVDSGRTDRRYDPTPPINLEVSRRILLHNWSVSVGFTLIYLLLFYGFVGTFNFEAALVKFWNIRIGYKLVCIVAGSFVPMPIMLRWKNNADIYLPLLQPQTHLDMTFIPKPQQPFHWPAFFLFYGVIMLSGFWLMGVCCWQWSGCTRCYWMFLLVGIIHYIAFYVWPRNVRATLFKVPEYKWVDNQMAWFVFGTFFIWYVGFAQYWFLAYMLASYYQFNWAARELGWFGIAVWIYRVYGPVGYQHFYKPRNFWDVNKRKEL